MKQLSRARRVGLCAILCALVLRLWDEGYGDKLLNLLTSPGAAAFYIYLETGRDVRFSPSLPAFSPDFMESPPAATLPVTEPTLPSFSDADGLELYYASTKEPDIPALLAQPLQWNLRGEEPTVLIIHTHTTESYTRVDEPYTESAAWRTTDEGYNMVSIGEVVREILEENGIPVIHDRELHDYPSYNGSYTRTRAAIIDYVNQNGSIQLILDLHRDAAGEGSHQMRTLAAVDGEPSAQLMLVMGTNYDTYEDNLSLALKVHAQLEAQCPGITRPLQLRAARFNQDLCPGTLLVEVGAAGNTHPEAQRAAEELAKAIVALAEGTETVQPAP
ncbi:MAG: stage II sporulation protein P [Clostridiales bacterium]|nr:stage II sporulation protein P [Clostridiales bacterium]